MNKYELQPSELQTMSDHYRILSPFFAYLNVYSSKPIANIWQRPLPRTLSSRYSEIISLPVASKFASSLRARNVEKTFPTLAQTRTRRESVHIFS